MDIATLISVIVGVITILATVIKVASTIDDKIDVCERQVAANAAKIEKLEEVLAEREENKKYIINALQESINHKTVRLREEIREVKEFLTKTSQYKTRGRDNDS